MPIPNNPHLILPFMASRQINALIIKQKGRGTSSDTVRIGQRASWFVSTALKKKKNLRIFSTNAPFPQILPLSLNILLL